MRQHSVEEVYAMTLEDLRSTVLFLDNRLSEKRSAEYVDELRLRSAVYTGTFLPTLNQIKSRLEIDHAKALEKQRAALRAEIADAYDLVDQMREQVESAYALIADWIEVFDMEKGESGKYIFSTDVRKLFADHDQLRTEHAAMSRELNRLGRTVTLPTRGRPTAASEQQIERVRTLHKAKRSLRAIADDTGLSVQTVRSILAAKAKQTTLLRREIDRLRQAEWRVRKRDFDALPKRIAALQGESTRLLKAAKGLDR